MAAVEDVRQRVHPLEPCRNEGALVQAAAAHLAEALLHVSWSHLNSRHLLHDFAATCTHGVDALDSQDCGRQHTRSVKWRRQRRLAGPKPCAVHLLYSQKAGSDTAQSKAVGEGVWESDATLK